MKHKSIHHLADGELIPRDRIRRRAGPPRLRPRATILFWMAFAVVPWMIFFAVTLLRD